MKNSKVLALVLGAVVGILAVGVAYAAFSTTLQINGNVQIGADWNVKYTSGTATTTKGTDSSTVSGSITPTASVSSPQTVLTGTASLTVPGDKVVFDYTISNLGSIAANLDGATLTCYSDSAMTKTTSCEGPNGDWSITASSLSKTALAAKTSSTTDTATGTITAEWKSLTDQPDLETAEDSGITVTDGKFNIYFKLVTVATQA